MFFDLTDIQQLADQEEHERPPEHFLVFEAWQLGCTAATIFRDRRPGAFLSQRVGSMLVIAHGVSGRIPAPAVNAAQRVAGGQKLS